MQITEMKLVVLLQAEHLLSHVITIFKRIETVSFNV